MDKKPFNLDARLSADTFLLRRDDDFQTLLMNDNRWPWIIVVPCMADMEDIDDLPHQQRDALFRYAALLSQTLKAMDVAESTNVATLGNAVRQFHLHVVGRNSGDPNWPGPVWGFETARSYDVSASAKFIDDFNLALKKLVPDSDPVRG